MGAGAAGGCWNMGCGIGPFLETTLGMGTSGGAAPSTHRKVTSTQSEPVIPRSSQKVPSAMSIAAWEEHGAAELVLAIRYSCRRTRRSPEACTAGDRRTSLAGSPSKLSLMFQGPTSQTGTVAVLPLYDISTW